MREDGDTIPHRFVPPARSGGDLEPGASIAGASPARQRFTWFGPGVQQVRMKALRMVPEAHRPV
ncbi:MAG: hypothetical protein OXE86_01505 [Alphaproteobacteria bacterium]|nr:hypothetical protein [Alphaproteobacteria bacterium]